MTENGLSEKFGNFGPNLASPVSFAKIPVGVRSLSLVAVVIRGTRIVTGVFWNRRRAGSTLKHYAFVVFWT